MLVLFLPRPPLPNVLGRSHFTTELPRAIAAEYYVTT